MHLQCFTPTRTYNRDDHYPILSKFNYGCLMRPTVYLNGMFTMHVHCMYTSHSYLIAWAAFALGAMTFDSLMDEFMKYEHSGSQRHSSTGLYSSYHS